MKRLLLTLGVMFAFLCTIISGPILAQTGGMTPQSSSVRHHD